MTDIGLYHNNFFLFVSQNFYIVGKQDISYPRVLFSRIGPSGEFELADVLNGI